MWYQNGWDRKDESSPDGVSHTAELGSLTGKDTEKPVRNFDLNVDLNENGESATPMDEVATVYSINNPAPDMKTEHFIEPVARDVKTESSLKLGASDVTIDSSMKPVHEVTTDSSTKPAPLKESDSSAHDMQYEGIPGWSLDEIGRAHV